MLMYITFVIGFSIIIQFAAAVLALRLIRMTNNRFAWFSLSIAMVIMTLRRLLPFSLALAGRYDLVDPVNEITALFISILLATGMATIAPIFTETSRADAARKLAEVNLRESEVNLRLAHEAGDIGAWKHDLTTGQVHFDDRACKHYGLKDLDNSLAEVFSKVYSDDRERLRTEFAAANRSDSNGRVRIEYRVVHPDGGIHWLAITGMVVFSGESSERRAVLAFGTSQDITERKQAQQKLEELNNLLEARVEQRTAELSLANTELIQANRAKDEFLSVMSHELRTPLNAILTLSESLQEGIYGGVTQKQSDSLGTIRESGLHLLEMINDILDLSKIEAGKSELNLEPVDLYQLCSTALRLVKQQAFKKQIRVVTEIDQGVEVILTDERRLKQMLVNLLGNAVSLLRRGVRSV